MSTIFPDAVLQLFRPRNDTPHLSYKQIVKITTYYTQCGNMWNQILHGIVNINLNRASNILPIIRLRYQFQFA